jgi:L-2,4-diaminobutyrate decarboxylase
MRGGNQRANTSTAAESAVADFDFEPDAALLSMGVNGLTHPAESSRKSLPSLKLRIDEVGLGTRAVIEQAAELVIARAQKLDASTAFAHMDPPAPLVSWIGELWNARLNQNLLHAETSPAARLIEEHIIEWLAPWFGMSGGHFTSGSTFANLTALWAARELGGVKQVVASRASHVSVAKATHLLGLAYRPVATNAEGVLDRGALPGDLSRTALVLTAGSASTGAIDPMRMAGRSAWTHVDAAWAGPLRLCEKYRYLLEGIQAADSVAISAHKLMFQPKGSALVLFRDVSAAHETLASGAGYLSTPNVGLLGSRPAAAVPLYLTLLAWGRQGLVERINRCMSAPRCLPSGLMLSRSSSCSRHR